MLEINNKRKTHKCVEIKHTLKQQMGQRNTKLEYT